MKKTLSIFVDESGNFQYPDKDSRFYIIGMVFHDQSKDIKQYVEDLDRVEYDIGIENHCFHAGPLIRKEKEYAILNRHFRGRIFSRMMAFAHRVDFKYHCLSVDKKFITSVDQIVDKLRSSLSEFLREKHDLLAELEIVKVYYDCGQAPITKLLHDEIAKGVTCPVEFVQDVRPEKYRLFQLADLICTLHLEELKLLNGEPMTVSEFKFFGGPKAFNHNVLRRIKAKEI